MIIQRHNPAYRLAKRYKRNKKEESPAFLVYRRIHFFQKMEKFLKEIAEITRKTVKKGSF